MRPRVLRTRPEISEQVGAGEDEAGADREIEIVCDGPVHPKLWKYHNLNHQISNCGSVSIGINHEVNSAGHW